MQNGFIDSSLTTGRRNLQAERRRVRLNGEASAYQGKTPETSYFTLLPSDRSDGHASLVLGVKGMGSLIAYNTSAETRMSGYDSGAEYNFSKYGANKGQKPLQYIGRGAVDLCLNKRINQNTQYYQPPTAAGNYSVVLGGAGLWTSAQSKYSAVLGGENNYTNNSEGAVVAGGKSNNANSGSYSAIIGGYSNQTSAQGAVVLGGRNQTAHLRGEVVFGHINTYGQTRCSGRLFNLHAISGNAAGIGTTAELGVDYQYQLNHDSAVGVEGYIMVPEYSVVTVHGNLIGSTPMSDQLIVYEINVTLKRGAGSSTAVVGDPVINILASTNGGSSSIEPKNWTVSLSTYSNGGLKTTVTTSNVNTVYWSFTGMVNRLTAPQSY